MPERNAIQAYDDNGSKATHMGTSSSQHDLLKISQAYGIIIIVCACHHFDF